MALIALAACGSKDPGSDAAGTPAPGIPAPNVQTDEAAARFLAQATFGPTSADINHAGAVGAEAWLQEQFDAPPTYQLAALQAAGPDANRDNRMRLWWKSAVTAPDQLRQRVAFALSEIFVVSDQPDVLLNAQYGVAYYHDLLVRNAFGSYRQLLEDVTLSPAMGRFLSMLGNRKPNEANGIRADENYAREIMQLFSIGLVQLAADGSTLRDTAGQPLPTYSQADIEGLARVFTGWAWKGATNFEGGPVNWIEPMQSFEQHHDTGAKTIIGDVAVPAGQTAPVDLQLALDTLANHPNVAPFISRHLIQKLVTSNPTPAYVARVSAVFANDGAGARGNLRAVIKAILLDVEARDGDRSLPAMFGKRREPVLQVTHLWRAMRASASGGAYPFLHPERDIGQAPYGAGSVFNFFSPFHSPHGPIADAGMVGPEFQLVNESSATQMHNFFANAVYKSIAGAPGTTADSILLDISREQALAADIPALLAHLDLLLMSGQMPDAMRVRLQTYLESVPAGDGTARALDAIYLIVTSPQYLVQK